jgi:hypothetical protein
LTTQKSVKQIITDLSSGMIGLGTAFYMNKSIYTCYHCINPHKDRSTEESLSKSGILTVDYFSLNGSRYHISTNEDELLDAI